jgi:hypothetical protein
LAKHEKSTENESQTRRFWHHDAVTSGSSERTAAHAVIQQVHEEYDKRSKMIANVLSSLDVMKQMVEDVTERLYNGTCKEIGGGDIRTKVDQMT